MSGPVKKFRAGAVSVALWENEVTINGQKKAILKASVERRYRDSDGNWKSSNSFSRNEIPLAIYGLRKAFEYMIEERSLGDGDDGAR